MKKVLWAILVVAGIGACGGSGTTPAGGACTTNADCASGDCGGTVDCGMHCICKTDADCASGQVCITTVDCGSACM
jgi:Cys-rich repeat protein